MVPYLPKYAPVLYYTHPVLYCTVLYCTTVLDNPDWSIRSPVLLGTPLAPQPSPNLAEETTGQLACVWITESFIVSSHRQFSGYITDFVQVISPTDSFFIRYISILVTSPKGLMSLVIIPTVPFRHTDSSRYDVKSWSALNYGKVMTSLIM